mmetsp:Transcript_34056/g.52337  ORF Transcript_34056/g.52337 Transcript_34056/m.52337 type:complete len:91 (+) Transcript_34056:177-449(+)
MTSMILTSRLSSSQMSSNQEDNRLHTPDKSYPKMKLIEVSSSSRSSGGSGSSDCQQVAVRERSHRISIHELDEQTPQLLWNYLPSDHGFS